MARNNRGGGRRTPRMALVALLVASAIPALGTPPALADPGDEVVIRGGGWGHGIGMSQYGARGQALEGKTAEEIVEYYYTGSTVTALESLLDGDHFMVTDSSPVWISLEQNATTFRFHPFDGPIEVCHPGNGGCSMTATPGENWQFVVLGNGTCRFKKNGANATPNAGPCTGTIRGLSPTGGKLDLDDQPSTRDAYARGRIQLRTPDGGQSVHASLEIGLERYLYGLAEVPASWETEALKAQAIAARSYAAYKTHLYGPEESMSESRKDQCWCHMFATVADQAFIGWDREDEEDEQPWVEAVEATRDLVASHPEASQNDIVAGFYSSSTGGATQNNEDVWGGAPVSYLRSVPDPWSNEPVVGNPFDTWEFSFSEVELANVFGLDGVSGLDVISRYDSGAPRKIRITGRLNGSNTKLFRTGAEVKSALGLTGRHIWTIDHGSLDFVTGDFDGSGTEDPAVLLGATGAWFEFSDDGKTRHWLNHQNNDTIEDPLAGDFDGDGDTDVVIRRSSTGGRVIGKSMGARFVSEAWGGGVADAGSWSDGVVGDFDGNGRTDIAEYRPSTATWDVLFSTGSGFNRTEFYDFSAANPQWGDFHVGDFDGDGKDDILHHDLVTENLHVLFSSGGSAAPALWQTLPADSQWHLRVGDFDGDGSDDVAAYDTATGKWWVMRGKANRTGTSPAVWWTFKNNNLLDQVVGDFNGDGRDDLANLAANRQWKVLTAKPAGGFAWGTWGSTPKGHGVSDVLVIDNDGDGDDDLVTYNPDTKHFHMHESNGATFAVSWWGSVLK